MIWSRPLKRDGAVKHGWACPRWKIEQLVVACFVLSTHPISIFPISMTEASFARTASHRISS